MTYTIVKVVALVRNIDHSSTKITYSLEDFSGQIEGHFWLNEEDSLNSPQIMMNTYARVVGTVRNTAGAKSIIIFSAEPITTINELNTHLLEVVENRYVAEEFLKVRI